MPVTPRQLKNRLDRFEEERGRAEHNNIETVFIIDGEITPEQREAMDRTPPGQNLIILPSNHRMLNTPVDE